MDCHKAGEYMMKYMDCALSGNERAELEIHADGCANCALDYEMYKSILEGFLETDMTEAPEGFEAAVLAKVRALPSIARPKEFLDNVVYAVWGVFSVLMGIGFVLYINRDAIMDSLNANTASVNLAALITPIYNTATELAGNVSLLFADIAAALGVHSSVIKYLVAAAFVAVAGIQFFVHRKGRDRVEAQ